MSARTKERRLTMKNQRLIWLSILILLLGVGCKKNVEADYVPLVFKSLTASSTNFPAGTSVNVNADVQGTGVTYHWSYNAGAISGSGSQVIYTNDSPGYHTLICTVQDSEGEVDARQINFYVQ